MGALTAGDFLTLPRCEGLARFRIGDNVRYDGDDFKVGQRRSRRIVDCTACSQKIVRGEVFGYTRLSALAISRGASADDRRCLCDHCLDSNSRVQAV